MSPPPEQLPLFPPPDFSKPPPPPPAEKKLTRDDLSKDQVEVFDEILSWRRHGAQSIGEDKLLTVGGYAGCLSGDTVIEYNRSNRINCRPLKLRDLYLKFNGKPGVKGRNNKWVKPELPTYMHSLWPDGTVSRNQVLAVFESGVKKVIRVRFSDGSFLQLTEDHPIATPSGIFVKAGALSRGDAVLARGTMKAGKSKGRRPLKDRPKRIIVNTRFYPHGAVKDVMCNGILYKYKRVARARLVYEAEMNGVSYEHFVRCLKKDEAASKKFTFLPRDYDVHHKDENTLNDALKNLKALPHGEHAKHHDHEDHLRLDYTREVKVVSIKPAGEEMTYDVQMESPANNFVANGIFVHNTGKSTLLGVFASELKRQGKLVAYVTFTGKASSVLARKLKNCGVETSTKLLPSENNRGASEKFGEYFLGAGESDMTFCGTVHRLIYRPIIDEGTEEMKGFIERTRLDRDYDLIVIDEASMIGGEMLERLKKFDIPILAVGDHGQLPPVMDVSTLMVDPDLRLERIHRQALGSPIIALSKVIRETGLFNRSLADGSALQFAQKQYVEKVMADIYETLKPINVGLICWTNRTRVKLNVVARSARGKKGPPEVGDVLICLRNMAPIYNGMRGVVCGPTRDQGGGVLSVRLRFPEEGIPGGRYNICAFQLNKERTFADLDEVKGKMPGVKKMSEAGSFFDNGYAMTCHKSQGSSFEHAVFYVDRPISPDDEDWRRFAYTAVTRAAKRLTVVT